MTKLLLCLSVAAASGLVPAAAAAVTDAIVFVSRQIPEDGSDFLPQIPDDRAMPGVGGRERFRVAAPGQLLVREPDGTLRVLIDGAAPSAATLGLVDVSAPAVSWDGMRIAFAGLPAPPTGTIDDTGSHAEPGRWRIFVIDADGSGLRQVTRDDPELDAIDMAAYGRAGETYRYDDTDPAWLPDGRLVFSSSRWLTVAQYGRARGTNLHVVNADGTDEHRITSERNGADRGIVDPVTGKIVFARWWRNGRTASDRLDAIRQADRGGHESYLLRDGLTTDPGLASGGPGAIESNEWIAAAIDPDGTHLELFTGSVRIPWFTNHYYGGTFDDAGVLYGNFFPDFPLTESGGFGGIRRYLRGAFGSEPIFGLMTKTDDFVRPEPPQSLTIIHSATGYAADPLPLPDGRLLFSWARDPATGAEDIGQDYGLFVIDPADPGTPEEVYDGRGTTELRAQLLRARPLPPVRPDAVRARATATPLRSDAELRRDGTFVFEALNVYANGAVDQEIVDAPPIGSAATIRFFADYQRYPLNADTSLNWPVLLDERPVSPTGAVRHDAVPADVPLFEDLRRSNGSVPLTTRDGNVAGGAFVSGMNHGRPGTIARCVGCHAGHTQIPVPATIDEARWTNLAPGADVVASSVAYQPPIRLVNRRARIEESFSHWRSAGGLPPDEQWVQLAFPVPVIVRRVRLYGSHDGTVVQNATVTLHDAGTATALASADSGVVAEDGSDTIFPDVPARVVRVAFRDVQGAHASLAEIEVVASGIADSPGDPEPMPPGSVRVSLDARGRPVLAWDAADAAIGVRHYRVLRSGTLRRRVRRTSFTDRRVSPGTSYTYQVQTVDRRGRRSAPSAPVTITAAAAPAAARSAMRAAAP